MFINLAGYLLLEHRPRHRLGAGHVHLRPAVVHHLHPGQIRVCEEIGSRERTYDTPG